MRASPSWFLLFPLLAACGPSPAPREPEPSEMVKIAAVRRQPSPQRVVRAPAPRDEQRWVAGTSYQGHYFCSQGDTNMVLQIDEVLRNGQIRGVFDFSHEESGAHGSFIVDGRVSSDGEVTFEPVEWLVRPPRYVAAPFRLMISEDGKSVTGGVLHPSCGAMEATRREH